MSGTYLQYPATESAAQLIGSISLTTQVVGTLPIANGGTNGITANAGFNNLSPMTTSGDLIVGSASGVAVRLARGVGNQVLTISTGSLIQSWATLVAPTKQLFSTVGSASYFTPVGCRFIKVTLVGGGGGSGGIAGGVVANSAGGGGGAGGATCIGWLSPTPSQVFALVVGAGGPGGLIGANAGANGSSSTFGASFIAGGGTGGGAGGNNNTGTISSSAVPGGAASGGDLNIPGGGGSPGFTFGVAGVSGALGGAGGSSAFGPGPQPVVSGAGSSSGIAGQFYGSGASAPAQNNNTGPGVGYPGAHGLIVVEEYY